MGWVLIGCGILMMLAAVLLTLHCSAIKKQPLILKDQPEKEGANRPSAIRPPQREQLEKTELL
ncbi:MAG: hypothetical protein HFG27_04460 [Provencibacterium sp.]|jgi:hypothetical protein|nr:hypothetical protein [Provencibacterium sp.]